MNKVDFIIIAIVACIVVIIGTYLYRAKKRGETCVGCPYAKQCGSKSSAGSCCSSAGYKPRKKKLSEVKYKKIFTVQGMTCQHCKTRVEEVINDMKGLSGSVDLVKGELTVSYSTETDDELIKSRLERAGYPVTGVKQESNNV